MDGLDAKAVELASGGRTVIHVAIDTRAAGLIAVDDAARDTSREAVRMSPSKPPTWC